MLATLALGLLVWALTAAAEPASPRSALAAATVAGLGLAATFLRVEARRGADALMPFALFGTSTFAGLSVLTFLLYAALGGLIVLLPFVADPARALLAPRRQARRCCRFRS